MARWCGTRTWRAAAARRRLQAMVAGGLPLRAWAEREKVRKFTVVEYELRLRQ